MKLLLFLFLFQSPDTVKVPMNMVNLYTQQIKRAVDSVCTGLGQGNVHFMEGQLNILYQLQDMNALQRQQEQAKKDTVKTKGKK